MLAIRVAVGISNTEISRAFDAGGLGLHITTSSIRNQGLLTPVM